MARTENKFAFIQHLTYAGDLELKFLRFRSKWLAHGLAGPAILPPRRLVLSPLQLVPRWWLLSLSGFCLLCNLCAPWHSCLSRLHTPRPMGWWGAVGEEKCQQLSVHWPRVPQCRQCINLIKSPASGQI